MQTLVSLNINSKLFKFLILLYFLPRLHSGLRLRQVKRQRLLRLEILVLFYYLLAKVEIVFSLENIPKPHIYFDINYLPDITV